MNVAPTKPQNGHPGIQWSRLLKTAAVLALVWLGLNGSDVRSWMIGIPAIAAAAALSTVPPSAHALRVYWPGVLAFAFYFLSSSLRGGWDVSCRVLHRRLPVAPGFVRFTTSLPEGPLRLIFINVVSLLPGTLSAGLEGDSLIVHSIDTKADSQENLRRLENRVRSLSSEYHEVAS